MFTLRPFSVNWLNGLVLRIALPLIAGVVMLVSSFLTWLNDPLGPRYTSWQLSVDSGWQIHSGLFNYGLLCLGCAVYLFVIAYLIWKKEKGMSVVRELAIAKPLSGHIVRASILCLVPLFLFLLQYLFVDMLSVAQLGRHEIQFVMTEHFFGYGLAAPFISIDPLSFDVMGLDVRVALLLNHTGVGFFVPVLSTWILLVARKLFANGETSGVSARKRANTRLRMMLGSLFVLLGLVLCGRAPLAFACDYQAQRLLAIGENTTALQWLDTAHMLNPSLDQLATYHLQRGQALYFLYPGQLTEESKAYLASVYNTQQDYAAAYQYILPVWQQDRQSPWVIDETSSTLEHLAEQTKPLRGIITQRLSSDNPSLPWLYQLLQVDPSNVYSRYLIGRIEYDLHDYAASMTQMFAVVQYSQSNDIQSSAYTYLGLSSEGMGDFQHGRTFLFRAVDLDPEYRNNTAREELSGLR